MTFGLREREREWQIPFPYFGNGNQSGKFHFQFSGTGTVMKIPFPFSGRELEDGIPGNGNGITKLGQFFVVKLLKRHLLSLF